MTTINYSSYSEQELRAEIKSLQEDYDFYSNDIEQACEDGMDVYEIKELLNQCEEQLSNR